MRNIESKNNSPTTTSLLLIQNIQSTQKAEDCDESSWFVGTPVGAAYSSSELGVPDIECCERRDRRERRRHRSCLHIPESATTAGAASRAGQGGATRLPKTKITYNFALGSSSGLHYMHHYSVPSHNGTAHLTSSFGHRLKATCITRPPQKKPILLNDW